MSNDMSDVLIEQQLASFNEAIARMDADPDEAARIRALADKVDTQMSVYVSQAGADGPAQDSSKGMRKLAKPGAMTGSGMRRA